MNRVFSASSIYHFLFHRPAADIVGGLDTLLPSGGGFSRPRYARTSPPAPIFEGESNLLCAADGILAYYIHICRDALGQLKHVGSTHVICSVYQ